MKTSAKPVPRVQDMTEGNPVRLILSFAVPLFIGNIFQQIYTMVDTMVVGHSLGDSAIAAIGATSSLYFLLLSFANGMNSGYGIVVTRHFGAHDPEGVRRSIAGMLALNMAAASLLSVFSLLFLRPLPTPILPFCAADCCPPSATICFPPFSRRWGTAAPPSAS